LEFLGIPTSKNLAVKKLTILHVFRRLRNFAADLTANNVGTKRDTDNQERRWKLYRGSLGSQNFMNFCPQTPKLGQEFYPSFVNARYDFGASEIRWCRIAHVNETIEIQWLVSRSPRRFAVGNGITSGGLKWQYIIVNCHFFYS